MKNSIQYILILLLLILSVSGSMAQSAASRPVTAMEQVERHFEKSMLKEVELQGFARRGIQKAAELMDLLKLIQTEDLDAAFEEAIEIQIKGLLVDSVAAEEALQRWLKEDIMKTGPSPSIIQPLEWRQQGVDHFISELALAFEPPNESVYLRMHLFRHEKKFGDQQQLVWTVLLEPY